MTLNYGFKLWLCVVHQNWVPPTVAYNIMSMSIQNADIYIRMRDIILENCEALWVPVL